MSTINFSYDPEWLDTLSAPFMTNAFIAGLCIALAAGVMGYFTIARRSTFAAHALAHIGLPGATGATGATGAAPEDVFASFANVQALWDKNSLITMFPDVTDPTGNIVQTDFSRITLQPGYYLVAYSISAIYRTASYMQVTPSYNGTSHMETSVYFATSVNGTSAGGSANFLINAPSETTLSLFYSSPVQATDGIFNMTIVKLNRTA